MPINTGRTEFVSYSRRCRPALGRRRTTGTAGARLWIERCRRTTDQGRVCRYCRGSLRASGYVADAQAAVKASIQFPAGCYVVWSGQFDSAASG
jgi:hypothetical protein